MVFNIPFVVKKKLQAEIAEKLGLPASRFSFIPTFETDIYDWYKKEKGGAEIPADQDPGVASVTRIFNYYKKYGYKGRTSWAPASAT